MADEWDDASSAGVSYQGRGVTPPKIINDFGYNAEQLDENDSNKNNGGYRGGRGGGGGGRNYTRGGTTGGFNGIIKPGNWDCSECSASNFSYRTTCFKCRTIKLGIDETQFTCNNTTGRFNGIIKPGNWDCSECSASNFSYRTTCFKCRTIKLEIDETQFTRNTTTGGFNGIIKPGNWDCSKCSASNFSYRTTCFKCRTIKIEIDEPQWTCNSCSTKNGKIYSKCQMCSQLKTGDTLNEFKRRWTCPSCKETKNDIECIKCQIKRPPRETYIPPTPSNDESEIFGTGIASGTNFNKYDSISVKVSENSPAPITTFEKSELCPFLLENIEKSGYRIPTPIQKHSIPIIMGKRDLMACAQTGSGKTAAFVLPIVNTLLSENKKLSNGKPHVVIISPTRELSTQIFETVRKFTNKSSLKTVIIYGGTNVHYQMQQLFKGCHILVATPGRLADFVDRGFITFEDVRFVVLDEADRMLDLGFLPGIKQLMSNETMSKIDSRQTLMFSATFPEDIQVYAGEFLKNYVFLAIGIVGGACCDVEQHFINVDKFTKRSKLIEILNEKDPRGTMVFVETQRNADFLASILSATSYPTTSIHGGRLQPEREEALGQFKKGEMHILIATSVAARGLDIKNVEHVINYDMPKTAEEYVHRIGRTGRVGNCGKATSFYDREIDSSISNALVTILEQSNQKVPDFLVSYEIGGSSKADNYGGRDVRKFGVKEAQEQEEQW